MCNAGVERSAMALRGILSFLSLLTFSLIKCEICMNTGVSITQKIENEGFHRNVWWLLEMSNKTRNETRNETCRPKSADWKESGCYLALYFDINAGIYVNKDELADLNHNSDVLIRVDGNVNIETPAYESTSHIAYVYLLRDNLEKVLVSLPIHLRYQRAQINGKYGKVHLAKPTVLIRCPSNIVLCGKRRPVINAPCSFANPNMCAWKNATYQSQFQDVEMLVPIGDLDDYPLVAIVTLLLGCAGCIYILSLLKAAPI